MVEIGRTSRLPSVELAGHQLACRLRLQLFDVRAADDHAEHARRMANELRLPLPPCNSDSGTAHAAPSTATFRGTAMVDEAEKPRLALVGSRGDAGHRSTDPAATRSLYSEAEPLLELAAMVHPHIAADARTLASIHNGATAVATAAETTLARDWAWLSGTCIHAQAVLAVGGPTTMQTAYELLLPASGMIASTGSFDAGPVDSYLAALADALGRTDDERHHREQLARLSAREGLVV